MKNDMKMNNVEYEKINLIKPNMYIVKTNLKHKILFLIYN